MCATASAKYTSLSFLSCASQSSLRMARDCPYSSMALAVLPLKRYRSPRRKYTSESRREFSFEKGAGEEEEEEELEEEELEEEELEEEEVEDESLCLR